MPPRKSRANSAPVTPAPIVVDNSKPSKKVKLDPVADSQQIEKKIVKGKAAVDSEVIGSQSFRVVQDSSAVYDATLNQSNVDHNNNKFYKCQLIQNELTNQFFLFTRWGRVGQKGQQNMDPQMSLHNGISSFNSKVRSKMNGGYTKLEINYQDEEQEVKPANAKKAKVIKSKIDPRIYDLMAFIFNQQLIDQGMKEIGYDAQKMPLGKLGDTTINEAYQVLNELLQEIKKKKPNQPQINQLNNQFYSLIPHNFGFQHMSAQILKTDQQVRDKLDMLQTLQDMKLTVKILKENTQEDINKQDENYKQLKCQLIPLEVKSESYLMVEEYVKKTNPRVKISQVFKINRDGESKRFKQELGNIQLLWHGSRVQNFGGILSQGLRIAPPEAPHNGYAYGKGIYLANHFTTSQGYSQPYNNESLILLCRSSLGKVGQYQGTNYHSQNQKYLLDGYHSAIGFASQELKPEAYIDFDNMKVPLKENQYGNAYIVYDVSQVQLEYLIRYSA